VKRKTTAGSTVDGGLLRHRRRPGGFERHDGHVQTP